MATSLLNTLEFVEKADEAECLHVLEALKERIAAHRGMATELEDALCIYRDDFAALDEVEEAARLVC